MNSLTRYNNRPKLTPQKKLRNKLNKYNWKVIIPFILINLLIVIEILLQIGEGGL